MLSAGICPLPSSPFPSSLLSNKSCCDSYIHRYTESTDTLSVYFSKPDHKTADYLFHNLEIIPPAPHTPPSEPWRAKASHLCVEDMYDVAYEFYFKGVGLREWVLEYRVRGPAKDYVIRSVYRREG